MPKKTIIFPGANPSDSTETPQVANSQQLAGTKNPIRDNFETNLLSELERVLPGLPKKKMSKHQAIQLIQEPFRLATTKTSHEVVNGKPFTNVFSEYYCFNPEINQLDRVRKKHNRYPTVPQRKKKAKEFNDRINALLKSGWSFYVDERRATTECTLHDALNKYLVAIASLRKDTVRSYKSMVVIFQQWLIESRIKHVMGHDFSLPMAMRYLDSRIEKKGIGNNTYNNYRQKLGVAWSWMLQRGYVTTNVFTLVPIKKTEPKLRATYVAEVIRQDIKKYIHTIDSDLYTPLVLAYSCLLRPKELLNLQISCIDLTLQTITVPPEVSKNGKGRTITIPDTVLSYFESLNLEKHPQNWYIVGRKPNVLQPGPRPGHTNTLSERWRKMREFLGLAENIKMYSLRDTGITDLLGAVGIPGTNHQTNHSSLEITSKYFHKPKEAHPDVKEKGVQF